MRILGDQLAAVIMAGGKGSRFGKLGQVQPKCLFPVGNETLLTRLLNQLQGARIGSIAVCCSPENVSMIQPAVDDYRESAGSLPDRINAFACPNSAYGLLPALAEMLSKVSARWYLVCLGDIYFAKAPFGALVHSIELDASTEGFLLTGTDEMSRDSAGTGVVACEASVVRAISYPPLDPAQFPRDQIYRWTGSFLFRRELTDDLEQNLANYRQLPFESWIHSLLRQGARCRWIDAGPFVNVNSVAEYQFLIGREGAITPVKTAHANEEANA